jgi:hypothetical protein
MSKFALFFCASLCVYSLHADAPMDAMPEFPPIIEPIQLPIEESPPAFVPSFIEEPKEVVPVKKIVEKKPEVSVNPFTGKIKGRKVRMRLRPDLDSRIIKELSKNDLVTVIGEKEDFWAVEAPAGIKAYVFRSFVLDNVVEGNRVNVRLEPSLDAPILAHLNSGDRIEDPSISPINPKWLEITPPSQTKFYIAKEYVEYAGGPEVKEQMDRRKSTAEQLFDATSLLSKTELNKPYEEIDFDRIAKGYKTLISDFSEFSELAEQAKDALATFQEEYLHKQITHTEAEQAKQYVKVGAEKSIDLEKFENISLITDKMKSWGPIEEALYLSWANINDNKTQQDYYEEQALAAVEITGIVEPYTAPVKAKPGDFLLRNNKDVPVGYIYSTQVNLQSLVGKNVTLVAAPRPNNNFAFPAYYVLSAE